MTSHTLMYYVVLLTIKAANKTSFIIIISSV